MKLLIVTPNFPPDIGGPASLSFELLNRLPPAVDVFVVSFSSYELDSPKNVRLVSTKGSMFKRQWRFFLACLKYGQKVDSFLLLEPGTVGPAGLLAGKLLGKRTVVKFFGDPVWEEHQRLRAEKTTLVNFLEKGRQWKNWRSILNTCVLWLSDHVIVPMDFLAMLLSKYYFIPTQKVTVLGCPLDVATAIPTLANGSEFSWKNYLNKLKEVLKK